jgi:hypothetical protein
MAEKAKLNVPDALIAADVMRQIVHQNGVKLFREGFRALDEIRTRLKKDYGVEITDEQARTFKELLARSVSTRKAAR